MGQSTLFLGTEELSNVWASTDAEVYDRLASNAERDAQNSDTMVANALDAGCYVAACREQRKGQATRSDARLWRETAAMLRAGMVQS